MTGPRPLAHKPERAPTLADLDERDRYAKLTAGSADAVRGSAKTWQTAITAFITLVTVGVIIKGRDSTTDLTAGWTALIVVLAGGGLLLAVFALWQTVAAEAGTHPGIKSLQQIRESHGTLDAYQVYLAIRAARRLRLGISSAAIAMTLLIVGIIAVWLAPPARGEGQTYLEITTSRSAVCGSVIAAPAGEVRLSVANTREPAVVPISQIITITQTRNCP